MMEGMFMIENTTTKCKIVNAAWELFYKMGYDNTTVDEIISLSETSKGSFYHYFSTKDELLESISFWFDDKYVKLETQMQDSLNSFEKLMYLNEKVFEMVEEKIPMELLAYMYSTQLVTKGKVHLLDKNRVYYKLITKIISEGQLSNQLVPGFLPDEITKAFALSERGIIFDWCISKGSYSLTDYGCKIMRMFMQKFSI